MIARMRGRADVLSPQHGSTSGRVCRRVIFLGNPNAGKTTLFNRMTGLRAKTANYPGTTVEVRVARMAIDGEVWEWVDLPGLYRLDGNSPDEKVAVEYLERAISSDTIPTQVVLVMDATRLERGLCLAAHVRDRVAEYSVALNMMDLAGKHRLSIDRACLESELQAAVIPVSARSGQGLEALREQLGSGRSPTAGCRARGQSVCGGCGGCPYAACFAWAENVCRKACTGNEGREMGKTSMSIDRWATHPLWGAALFLLVMAVLFQALFLLAETPMGWIEEGFALLAHAGTRLIPEGLWQSFVVDGILSGLAGTLVFLPQIMLLFFLIALLEDTGYLARAAFVVDRWMAKVGLPGRAFLPMLSAHACAIPAIMSARTVEDPRDRLVTILILPLLSCSARIPVYVMVTAMLFADRPVLAGMVFTGAYFFGLIAALCIAWVLKKTLLRGDAQPLLIELPGYKWPSLRTALWTALDRGALFLKRAGGLILCIIIGLWALGSFPRLEHADLTPEQMSQAEVRAATAGAAEFEHAVAALQLEHSYAGRIGRTLQPVFAPLGFDWQITVGVLASFAAREVIASTLAVLHGLGEDAHEDPVGVAERLRDSVNPATGLSLLVFFILAMQCLPTLVITRKETGTWKWALFQLLYMSVLAYAAAWLTYRVAGIWL